MKTVALACVAGACLLLGFTVPRGHAHKCVLWSEDVPAALADRTAPR